MKGQEYLPSPFHPIIIAHFSSLIGVLFFKVEPKLVVTLNYHAVLDCLAIVECSHALVALWAKTAMVVIL